MYSLILIRCLPIQGHEIRIRDPKSRPFLALALTPLPPWVIASFNFSIQRCFFPLSVNIEATSSIAFPKVGQSVEWDLAADICSVGSSLSIQ